jgi:hypothetical protein
MTYTSAGNYRLGVYNWLHESGFTSASAGFLFTPTGTQTVEIGTTPLPAFTVFGLGSSFGSTVVAPFAIPCGGGFGLPGNPPPTDVPRTVRTPLQAIVITGSGTGGGQRTPLNLFAINGHTVQFEGMEDLADEDLTNGAVFVRLIALTVKGRIFLIAGTRISYSAPGQPGVFAASSGGGFIDIDDSSQIVGAFVLQDVIYIATRRQLFSLSFSEDPSRDGQLRPVAAIKARGAWEYENVGYIAVREGLYRVIQGQLEPTFVPSTDPDMSYPTYGLTGGPGIGGGDPHPGASILAVPRHCTIAKVGPNIILGGVGKSTDVEDQIRALVYNIDLDAWTTWTANTLTGANGNQRASSFLNMTTPLVELPSRPHQSSKKYWAATIKDRVSTMALRFRSFILEGNLDTLVGIPPARMFPRLRDTLGTETNPTRNTRTIHCHLITPWLNLNSPLTHKRLHRLWFTGKFASFPDRTNKSFTTHDFTTFFYNGPNTDLAEVAYNAALVDSEDADPYDRTPSQVTLMGSARFESIAFRVTEQIQNVDDDWSEGQQFMNRALDKIYVDATVYNTTNKPMS